MRTIALAPFADDGELADLSTAQFIRSKKLKGEFALDFTGLSRVSAEVLAELLHGFTAGDVLDRVSGADGQVADALERWLDARRPARPATTTGQPATSGPVQRPATGGPAPGAEVAERYTPTRLVHRLRTQLTRYLVSAYPLNDPLLIDARNEVLERSDHGRLICQEPYVETNARYRSSRAGFSELGLEDSLGALYSGLAAAPQDFDLDRTVLFPTLYEHQAKSLTEFLTERKSLVVATGTGSGKTECFLLPMMGHIHREARERPASYGRRAVRCLILYPMNALVNDQLGRLRVMFGSSAVREEFQRVGKRHPLFGMYTGRTPYPGPKRAERDQQRVEPILKYYLGLSPDMRERFRKLGRYPAKNLDAFYAKHLEERAVHQSGAKKGQSYVKHNWDKRLRTGLDDAELLTRQEMVREPGGFGGAPDILITNYSMLEFMLMRPFERSIFQETAEWLEEDGNEFLIVLDEAHMYRGARGAEVAFLLRRLLSRLGVQDRPDKVRVIATSASLGEGDAAERAVLAFAADLTGKSPDAFKLIQGKRDVPTPVAPGEAGLAAVLAAVDLTALHETAGFDKLRELMAPVLGAFGVSSTPEHEEELFRELYLKMRGHPVVNQLLTLTAGQARSLGNVADGVFPGVERRLEATETLLTLGVLARPGQDEPGLVPAQIHLMLRGLNGLYACVNENCPGRQAHPGERAPFGKLFTEARPSCDACGARVFEMASCRDCGSPYLLAFVRSDLFDRRDDDPPRAADVDFFWGETEGAVTRVQVLGVPPRTVELAHEIALHRATGFVDHSGGKDGEGLRKVWLAQDRSSGGVLADFPHCPVCLPPGGRRKARISDFRSRGEQPFTAILDAQFAEQPPQNHDTRLPNRGRKVLVFSDGRQKAARLAPALETSHARDAFRQVLLLAARELEKVEGVAVLSDLYPATVWMCASRGINVFPSNGDDERPFHHHLVLASNRSLSEALALGRRGQMQPAACFAQALFSELTDRYYSVPALGLGTIEEDPSPFFGEPFRDLPALGLSDAAFRVVFRTWVRTQFELNRFLPGGARKSLRDGFDRPTGLDVRKEGEVMPARFRAWLARVLPIPPGEDEATWTEVAVSALHAWLVKFIRSGSMIQEEDLYYFEYLGLALRVRLDDPWFACVSCGRVVAEHVDALCPECLGAVQAADRRYLDDRTGYYRDQVRRAFDPRTHEPFGLLAAEHSAQLTGIEEEEAFIKTERYELQFQDVPTREGDPSIDVLSCTTTMEVGIDIGALSGVALRNVPPHVANYQQRAGRAGRRGRSVASVVTYAHGSSHDSWFYESPARIISGAVRPPVVYIENQQVLERHINAWIFQVFFHDVVAANPGSFRLLEALGTVDDFLSEQNFWSFGRFTAWLTKKAPELQRDIRSWVPTDSWGLQAPINVEATVVGAVDRLLARLETELPLDLWRRRDDLEEIDLESLNLQLEEKLLKTLIDRAIVPRYAFPTDVVSFWVSKAQQSGKQKGKRDFDYQPQRELALALSEYAPGRSLTIDKFRYTSAALYSPHAPGLAHVLARSRHYTSCGQCGFVSLKDADAALAACPVCGTAGLNQQEFIVPHGFAPDLNTTPEVDRGGAISYAGHTGRAELEVQDQVTDWSESLYSDRLRVRSRPDYLVSVNKGILNKGFWLCPDCGLSEPVAGPQFSAPRLGGKAMGTVHPNPLVKGGTCTGQPVGPYYLGYQFPTDVLLLRLILQEPVVCRVAPPPGQLTVAGRVAASTAVETITLAASRVLQIDEGEMGGNWLPVAGAHGGAVDLFLYDTLPGGAGYTRLTQANLSEVLRAALGILERCEGDCPTACYRCVLHYGNRFFHHGLDRHLGAALLNHVMHGTTPALTEAAVLNTAERIAEVLRLRGVDHEVGYRWGDLLVPLVVRVRGKSRWVAVHHALSDGKRERESMGAAARAAGAEVVAIDAFTVQHDLPTAVGRVT